MTLALGVLGMLAVLVTVTERFTKAETTTAESRSESRAAKTIATDAARKAAEAFVVSERTAATALALRGELGQLDAILDEVRRALDDRTRDRFTSRDFEREDRRWSELREADRIYQASRIEEVRLRLHEVERRLAAWCPAPREGADP